MKKTFYLNDSDDIVDKEHATHFYVQEFDENGELINNTHFGIKKNNETNFEDTELTSEEMEALKNIKLADGTSYLK